MHSLYSPVIPSPKTLFAVKALLRKYIPEERHKRAVEASGLKAGETLTDMAMDGIVLAPPPSVVKVSLAW